MPLLGDLDTSTADGLDFYSGTRDMQAEFLKTHASTTRPAYVVAGTLWLQTSVNAGDAWNLMLAIDDTTDVRIGQIAVRNDQDTARSNLDKDGDTYTGATDNDDEIEAVIGGTQRILMTTTALNIGADTADYALRVLSSYPMTIPTGAGTDRPAATDLEAGMFWLNTDDNKLEVVVDEGALGLTWQDVAFDSDTATISSLTDTAIGSPANGQTLIYNAATSRWENGTPVLSSGDLSDVSNSAPSDGEVHVWNATANEFVAGQVGGGTIADGGVSPAKLLATAPEDSKILQIVGNGDSATFRQANMPTGNALNAGSVTIAAGDGISTRLRGSVTTWSLDDNHVRGLASTTIFAGANITLVKTESSVTISGPGANEGGGASPILVRGTGGVTATTSGSVTTLSLNTATASGLGGILAGGALDVTAQGTTSLNQAAFGTALDNQLSVSGGVLGKSVSGNTITLSVPVAGAADSRAGLSNTAVSTPIGVSRFAVESWRRIDLTGYTPTTDGVPPEGRYRVSDGTLVLNPTAADEARLQGIVREGFYVEVDSTAGIGLTGIMAATTLNGGIYTIPMSGGYNGNDTFTGATTIRFEGVSARKSREDSAGAGGPTDAHIRSLASTTIYAGTNISLAKTASSITISTMGSVTGPAGPKGDKGDTGDTGPAGPQGPAGAVTGSLTSLSDVSGTALDGNVLTYGSATGLWTPAAPAASGGGLTAAQKVTMVSGLEINTNNNSSVKIAPGWIYTEDGKHLMQIDSELEIVSNSSNWDTGSFRYNKWYYIWLFRKTSDGSVSVRYFAEQHQPHCPSWALGAEDDRGCALDHFFRGDCADFHKGRDQQERLLSGHGRRQREGCQKRSRLSQRRPGRRWRVERQGQTRAARGLRYEGRASEKRVGRVAEHHRNAKRLWWARSGNSQRECPPSPRIAIP